MTSGPGAERRLVSAANPGAAAWSRDGSQLAYIAHGSVLSSPRTAVRRASRSLTSLPAPACRAGRKTIGGTPLWGDVIQGLAGNDQIHANDGHTDRANCGPGRDTVWADRTDRLTGCEIVHR